MKSALQLLLMVALPLAWGFGSEQLIDLIRRRRRRPLAPIPAPRTESSHDGVV